MASQSIFALIDCNNFFVSCERVFRPDLWNKPVTVLSNNDGCIVARSNEVKAMGVRMAAPLFEVEHILRQNNVTLFSANFRLYGDFSQRVVTILQQACPRVEVYSVDESFLEISGMAIDDCEQWALDLRQRILSWTGIPVSIGVAPTKTLAKAAAEYAKKNAETRGVWVLMAAGRNKTVDEHRCADLLRWLPVGDVWGIGWRTAPTLQQRGISTAHDLTQASDKWILAQLGIGGLKTVHELRGEARREMAADEPQKSIARTRSFSHRVRDYYEIEGAVATFAAQAAAKLREQDQVAGSMLVFVRTSHRLEEQQLRGTSTVVHFVQPTASTGDIIAGALQGLGQIFDSDFSYKKAGVVLLDLSPQAALQLSMLQDAAPSEAIDRQRRLMQAVDAANEHFGATLIRHASEHIERTTWRSKRERRSPQYTTHWQELPVVRS